MRLRNLFRIWPKKNKGIKNDPMYDMLDVRVAKISRDGHPICPKCQRHFSVLAEELKKESRSRAILRCPECGTQSGL